MTVNLPDDSKFAGRSIAEVFDRFPELVVVAIIHKQQIQLPRKASRLKGGDQLLIAASDTTSIEGFKNAAGSKAGHRAMKAQDWDC